MTGVLVFGSMAQKEEKSGNLYRLTGLLEVERPDGPCFHIHKLDDLRIFVGIDYPVALRRDAKSTPLIFCLVRKHPPRYIILIQISRILGYNFACKDYMYKSSKGCRLNQATTHPTNFHN